MRNLAMRFSTIIFLLMSSDISDAKDLSSYPCTVFGANACFRLPAGTHVNYSSPADFDIYDVLKDRQSVATIYIGNAPQREDTSTDAEVIELSSGTIEVHRNKALPAATIDIYIVPATKNASTVHISAELTPSTRIELLELLSSFRPCKAIRSGGQRCPSNPAWSNELTNAVKP